jgi:hypothetical protein
VVVYSFGWWIQNEVQPVKRRRALVETNLPRNSRPQTHPDDEAQSEAGNGFAPETARGASRDVCLMLIRQRNGTGLAHGTWDHAFKWDQSHHGSDGLLRATYRLYQITRAGAIEPGSLQDWPFATLAAWF